MLWGAHLTIITQVLSPPHTICATYCARERRKGGKGRGRDGERVGGTERSREERGTKEKPLPLPCGRISRSSAYHLRKMRNVCSHTINLFEILPTVTKQAVKTKCISMGENKARTRYEIVRTGLSHQSVRETVLTSCGMPSGIIYATGIAQRVELSFLSRSGLDWVG